MGSALSLVTRVVLTRSLGPTDYGHYALAMAWAGWAAVAADLGLPTLLVRMLPRYHAGEQWGLIRGLLRTTDQCILFGSTVGALVVGFVGLRLSPSPATQVHAFWAAALLVPLAGLTAARSGALRGLRCVVTSEMRHLIVRGIVLASLGGCLFAAVSLSPLVAVSITWLAFAIALAALSMLLRAALPPQVVRHAPATDTRAWLTTSVPMLLLGAVYLLNRRIDVVMLGALQGAREAGIYSIAADWAGIVTYPLVALAIALSPAISQLYGQNRMDDLQCAVTKGLRVVAPFAAGIMLSIVLAGRPVLAIHGPQFAEGYLPLVALSCGQLVATLSGTIGVLLVMTRHEIILLALNIAAATVNICLNAVLIPRWGMQGAAFATATSVTATAVAGAWLVRRHLAINSTIFARLHVRS